MSKTQEFFKRYCTEFERECLKVLAAFFSEAQVKQVTTGVISNRFGSPYTASAHIQNKGNSNSYFYLCTNYSDLCELGFEKEEEALDFLGELANTINGHLLDSAFLSREFGYPVSSPPLLMRGTVYRKNFDSISVKFMVKGIMILCGMGVAAQQESSFRNYVA
jgi:hypothetical protein